MPSTAYRYAPEYGIDRYAPPNGTTVFNDGGAVEDNDNLVVTVWETMVSAVEPEPPFFPIISPEKLLIPYYATDDVDPDMAAAFTPAMKSRCSARFWYEPELILEPEEIPIHTVVMRPPLDYKQQMYGAVELNEDGELVAKKSLLGNYAWRATTVLQVFSLAVNFGFLGSSFFSIFSTIAPLPDDTPESLAAWFPYLKTNGADGNPPEYFDVSTPAGIQEMLDAVERGDYYIAMLNLDSVLAVKKEGGGTHVTVQWPHSGGRNGP